jgi:hypothetical protein
LRQRAGERFGVEVKQLMTALKMVMITRLLFRTSLLKAKRMMLLNCLLKVKRMRLILSPDVAPDQELRSSILIAGYQNSLTTLATIVAICRTWIV